jgi:hypothetical protein
MGRIHTMAAGPLIAAVLAISCSPENLVVEGDVALTSEADLDRIRDCTRITGSLTAKRAAIIEIDLPRLEQVGGRLALQKNKTLTHVRLPALRSVGEAAKLELIVERNPKLETLDLKSLTSAADGVIVRLNPRLERLDLQSLGRVGRYGVEIASNDGIEAFDLPGLSATPRLYVESCYRMARLGLGSLARADDLRIKANPSLKRITAVVALPAGEGAARPGSSPGAAGVLEVRDNFALPTCEATRLRDRLAERGGGGAVKICKNKTDSCEPVGCEPSVPAAE